MHPRRSIFALISATVAVLLILATPTASATPLAARGSVDAFIRDMVTRHGFDESALRSLFDRVDVDPSVVRYNTPRHRTVVRSWRAYRANHVDSTRIVEGIRFWDRNAATLERASQQYGVPEEVIVAIIGVETVYGRNTGSFQTFSTLATLAFEYLRRADFFRDELEHFLLLTRDHGMDPLALDGSFSGAVGLPQFMPGSYRRYGVDFDGDGRVDLRNSVDDAIGSVANFLAKHGWERDTPVILPATVRGKDYERLIEAGIEPRWNLRELAAHGVFADSGAPPDARAALIDLPSPGAATQFVLGLRNFYVITRYNRSNFYAMSVHELARSLRNNRTRSAMHTM